MFKKKESRVLDEVKMELLFKIKPIIAKQLGIKEDQIVPVAKLEEDLGMDSLDSIELIMILEDTFDIEIPDEAAEKMLTIQDIIVYLAGRIKKC